jgi:AraC-like DNA-binding protein
MLYAIGIFVSLFLALLIFTKKGRNLSDTLLGVWMVTIGVHLFAYYSFSTGLIYTYPFLIGFNLPFPFLHGPFLFIYTLSLSNPEAFRTNKWLAHFILPAGILISVIPFLLLPAEQKKYVFQHDGKGYETYIIIVNTILSISGLAYIYMTNRILLKHRKRIVEEFSYQEKINLDWLRFLFYGMGMIWLFIILGVGDEWIFTLVTFFVIFIGYFGIRQVGIFTSKSRQLASISPQGEEVSQIEKESRGAEKRKYAKSGLTDDSARALHTRLKLVMREKKVYLQPELTLVELAAQLDIHPNYLSQVINEIEGVNFYDYINGLRVEEFKRAISDPENKRYTLLTLAYDCGFNSKTSFNRFFKKVEGKSPSEYLKALNTPVSTSFPQR